MSNWSFCWVSVFVGVGRDPPVLPIVFPLPDSPDLPPDFVFFAMESVTAITSILLLSGPINSILLIIASNLSS